ncbi:tetraacyldisaccharide 4'-kinase [Confluentibacter flavum]|uniref:Tetraacyldisaccharide 4'-kinase n=1 Tax=Confluentibacter flavum TaxID=1909700 RepID=A0A2N3HG96_9FLAO|nr:tetraacyldisaccharide 4'-kinase [Confluentibacter flavum]PKQ43933.1 tetraacyldisaccharide 4'-kinase [Confluentibacter flavum]
MKLIRKITFPFVPIYYAITTLRNKLYDLGIKKSISYDFPIICIGNLSVGGTGKTPMVEYLIHLLKHDYKVATLSRGYKRKTKGFQLANEKSSVDTLGDEPFQFYNKFKNDVLVAVDSDRNNGIKTLISLENRPEVILLDDAFQHRKVKAGFNILLTAYHNMYTDDFVLPTGNLREPKSGAKRANVIVVTKCPTDLTEDDKVTIIKKLDVAPYQHVFFSFINYAENVFSGERSIKLNDLKDFALVTGIANASALVQFLKEKQFKFEHLNFNDHHDFSEKDIKELETKEMIITTEKDFMRLKQFTSLKSKLFYLPIAIGLDNEPKFNTLIKDFCKKVQETV